MPQLILALADDAFESFLGSALLSVVPAFGTQMLGTCTRFASPRHEREVCDS